MRGREWRELEIAETGLVVPHRRVSSTGLQQAEFSGGGCTGNMTHDILLFVLFWLVLDSTKQRYGTSSAGLTKIWDAIQQRGKPLSLIEENFIVAATPTKKIW